MHPSTTYQETGGKERDLLVMQTRRVIGSFTVLCSILVSCSSLMDLLTVMLPQGLTHFDVHFNTSPQLFTVIP